MLCTSPSQTLNLRVVETPLRPRLRRQPISDSGDDEELDIPLSSSPVSQVRGGIASHSPETRDVERTTHPAYVPDESPSTRMGPTTKSPAPIPAPPATPSPAPQSSKRASTPASIQRTAGPMRAARHSLGTSAPLTQPTRKDTLASVASGRVQKPTGRRSLGGDKGISAPVSREHALRMYILRKKAELGPSSTAPTPKK